MMRRTLVVAALMGMLVMPIIVIAQSSAGEAADKVSNCKPPGPRDKGGTDGLPCKDLLNPVSGICEAGQCKGTSFMGLNGSQLMMVGNLLGQLLKGNNNSSDNSSVPSIPYTGTSGCTSFYNVTTPSSDPCAIYTPPSSPIINTSGSSTQTADQLLQLLGGGSTSGGTGTALDNLNGQLGNGTPTTTSSTSGSGNNATNPTVTSLSVTAGDTLPGDYFCVKQMYPLIVANLKKGDVFPVGCLNDKNSAASSTVLLNLKNGDRGNIIITSGGATIYSGSRDATHEIAGFYGSDTLSGNQPQGFIASMCMRRPWAGSIVSYVIPPGLFDSVCKWGGYQVGITEQADSSGGGSTKTFTQPLPQATTTVYIPTGQPDASIWAVPARVPLGTRTSVFWRASNVQSCAETSSDNSFHQNSLSGGASTVAITQATTFTILCNVTASSTITKSVTVDLSL